MAEDTSVVVRTTERELTLAANHYIRNRKPIPQQNEKSRNYWIDLNITLLETTAEAYGVSVEDLDKKVKEQDGQITEERA